MDFTHLDLFNQDCGIYGAKLTVGEQTLESIMDKALKGRINEIDLFNSFTNELGIKMNEAATEVIAIQLKKFIALNAFRAEYNINRNRNIKLINYYIVQGERYHESVFIFKSNDFLFIIYNIYQNNLKWKWYFFWKLCLIFD